MSKHSVPSMRDAKRAAAEQSLLDAAEVELAAAGFAATSMQSIAAVWLSQACRAASSPRTRASSQ